MWAGITGLEGKSDEKSVTKLKQLKDTFRKIYVGKADNKPLDISDPNVRQKLNRMKDNLVKDYA